MAQDTLTVTDNRTGKVYVIPIRYGTYPEYGASISAMDLRQIRVSEDDFGLLSFDPGLTNTETTASAITFIDGERGILRYRGYPIEQLAEKSTFLEVAYLLIHGKLPTFAEFTDWTNKIVQNMLIHESIKKFLDGFHSNAHAMGVFVGTLGAKSTFYPAAKHVLDPKQRMRETINIIASVPTIAAYTYRHSCGLPYVYPDPSLSYIYNFLNMLFRMQPGKEEIYQNPVIERALDVLFILHADHEQNCSTTTMRTVGSALSDPYSAISAAAGALYGQLHGGANQEALEMLAQIGSTENIPAFIKRVKNHETRLMGFGHRVYKNYDPRAKIIKKMADQVLEVTGPDPLIDVARELECIALSDEYFIKRKLYPNVDFYSGIIYKALGFPVDMFPVLFALARTAGWLSHWLELMDNEEERKIVRPRQQYVGEDEREYVPMDDRT